MNDGHSLHIGSPHLEAATRSTDRAGGEHCRHLRCQTTAVHVAYRPKADICSETYLNYTHAGAHIQPGTKATMKYAMYDHETMRITRSDRNAH